eukprot:5452122-Alexandrium_andersonii.AAC.1
MCIRDSPRAAAQGRPSASRSARRGAAGGWQASLAAGEPPPSRPPAPSTAGQPRRNTRPGLRRPAPC